MFKKTIKDIDLRYNEGEATDAFIKSLTGARDANGNLIETTPSTNATQSSAPLPSNIKPITFIEPQKPKVNEINGRPVANIDEAISNFIHYYYEILKDMETTLKVEKSKIKNNESYGDSIDKISVYRKNMSNLIKQNVKLFTYTPSDNLGF